MLEIIVRGRGGQGAVTFSQLLAIAAFECGIWSQSFPIFGIERRGAPATAFVRIDDKPIRIRSQIYQADIEVILDSTLLNIIDLKNEIKKNGTIIINSKKTAEEIKRQYKIANYKVYTVDATSIALEVFKKNIVNTALLGAFSAFTKIITIESIFKALEEKFESREAVIINKKAVREVYDHIVKFRKGEK